mmetsp:Transcript_14757/g.51386  ORF Transcript_14757/g.51386 Transcript_14757/m.51386 type:complete len:233 (+) Transcript_14757:2437-3135(+)
MEGTSKEKYTHSFSLSDNSTGSAISPSPPSPSPIASPVNEMARYGDPRRTMLQPAPPKCTSCVPVSPGWPSTVRLSTLTTAARPHWHRPLLLSQVPRLTCWPFESVKGPLHLTSSTLGQSVSWHASNWMMPRSVRQAHTPVSSSHVPRLGPLHCSSWISSSAFGPVGSGTPGGSGQPTSSHAKPRRPSLHTHRPALGAPMTCSHVPSPLHSTPVSSLAGQDTRLHEKSFSPK